MMLEKKVMNFGGVYKGFERGIKEEFCWHEVAGDGRLQEGAGRVVCVAVVAVAAMDSDYVEMNWKWIGFFPRLKSWSYY
ncbi:hypothetical protein C5167_047270 [Papaver somniferum]|uniref:Uncharacterized protein n=1 Tax=Papaver somniferum TaxID=3469 RepID=A0A4Y7LG56_PAPSO|nr:hypothetical protein C5167_047270 [Papaver somniferum]